MTIRNGRSAWQKSSNGVLSPRKFQRLSVRIRVQNPMHFEQLMPIVGLMPRMDVVKVPRLQVGASVRPLDRRFGALGIRLDNDFCRPSSSSCPFSGRSVSIGSGRLTP